MGSSVSLHSFKCLDHGECWTRTPRWQQGWAVPVTLNLASARRDLGSVQDRAVAFFRSRHRVVSYSMLISILFSLVLNISGVWVLSLFFNISRVWVLNLFFLAITWTLGYMGSVHYPCDARIAGCSLVLIQILWCLFLVFLVYWGKWREQELQYKLKAIAHWVGSTSKGIHSWVQTLTSAKSYLSYSDLSWKKRNLFIWRNLTVDANMTSSSGRDCRRCCVGGWHTSSLKWSYHRNCSLSSDIITVFIFRSWGALKRGATARAVLPGEFGFKQEGQTCALSIWPFGLSPRSCPEWGPRI